MVITQYEYIFVIAQVEAKQGTSVNNQDIIQMYLGYNLLISQLIILINASFVDNKQWFVVMFNYQSFLCLC